MGGMELGGAWTFPKSTPLHSLPPTSAIIASRLADVDLLVDASNFEIIQSKTCSQASYLSRLIRPQQSRIIATRILKVLKTTQSKKSDKIRILLNPSLGLPQHIKDLWEWTLRERKDADKMSSLVQGQWMIWMAQWICPNRSMWCLACVR